MPDNYYNAVSKSINNCIGRLLLGQVNHEFTLIVFRIVCIPPTPRDIYFRFMYYSPIFFLVKIKLSKKVPRKLLFNIKLSAIIIYICGTLQGFFYIINSELLARLHSHSCGNSIRNVIYFDLQCVIACLYFLSVNYI